MNDDYKKGYADAMGWKIENHLEHLPEQAPMKWLKFNDKGDTFDNTPFYTTPPQRTWVGLTDSEMLECLKAVDVATAVNLLMSQYEMPPTFKVYAEAIQAKLKEKNHG
jgi:hypothetical protein